MRPCHFNFLICKFELLCQTVITRDKNRSSSPTKYISVLCELPNKRTVYDRHPQIWTIPAEFSSNPKQTHLSLLIGVFKIIIKSQLGEFDQGWS